MSKICSYARLIAFQVPSTSVHLNMGNSSSSPQWDIDRDVPNLEGKVIIVTGGNAGLGFATVQHLVRHGAKIYMASRSKEKVEAAIAKLDLREGAGSVEWLELDLGDPRKAKASAEKFLEKEARLEILVNNAAMVNAIYKKSIDDIQDVMVTNPFIFTKTLLPLLEKTAAAANEPNSDVRIVNVSSRAIQFLSDDIRFRNREDFNDEHTGGFSPSLLRAGRSKLANILFTKQLQSDLDAKNVPIITIALSPGTVNTEGTQIVMNDNNWILRPILTFLSNLLLPTAVKGAYTQVFAAVAPIVRQEADKYKGVFLMPPAVISKTSKPGESGELAKELWETTEALLNELGV
ncbi:NAD-P-binding protein [Cristinia sonorae]|uniref:NAD-P-binding protein n=1 Tax=Cristinia sonorae TaxID=1940300 RepID=A0A8K0UKS7_9AGAR|nr:NAD-P-binding protein [Cristinia sonorae]